MNKQHSLCSLVKYKPKQSEFFVVLGVGSVFPAPTGKKRTRVLIKSGSQTYIIEHTGENN